MVRRHVIATERHDSRRIDRQLFGRCGRQGDEGSFEVVVSLEDPIVRLNCPAPLLKLMHARSSRRLASYLITLAQWIVERRHFNTRRNVMQRLPVEWNRDASNDTSDTAVGQQGWASVFPCLVFLLTRACRGNLL